MFFKKTTKFLYTLQARQFSYILLQKVLNCTLFFFSHLDNISAPSSQIGDLTALLHTPQLLELLTKFLQITSEKQFKTCVSYMIRQLICQKSVGNLNQSNFFCDVGNYQVIPHSQHSRYLLLNSVQHFITFLSSVRIFSHFSLFFIHHSRVPNRFHKFSSSPARVLENLWNLFDTRELVLQNFEPGWKKFR